MRTFKRVTISIAGLAVAASLAFPSPTVADTGPEAPRLAEVSIGSFSPAELEDLAFYADINKREFADVLDQFTGVSEFTRAVEQAQKDLPNDFVYAEWGFGSGFLAVTASGLEAAKRLVEESGASADVIETDRPSEPEQQDLLNAVAQAMKSNAVADFKVSYDYQSNRVLGSIHSSSIKSLTLPESLTTQAARLGVRIEIVTTLSGVSEAASRGGMGYSGCTGGFIGRPPGSTYRGIITAKHCTTRPATYDGSTTTANGSSTILGHDLRFTRFASGTWNNTFRYDAGAYRSVTSQTNPVVGATVCKYGRITGRFCTTVARNNVTTSGGSGMTETADGSVQPGDSGGPWYFGTSAIGITWGYFYPANQPTNPSSDVFTKLGSDYSALTS